MARPMPVFPLVGSTRVAPGARSPRRSASSTMATAIRSLTLPPGLSDSIFASTVAPSALARRLSLTSGVPPPTSSTEPAIRARPPPPGRFCPMAPMRPGRRPSDVVHGPGHALALLGQALEVRQRNPVDDRRHGRAHLLPQLGQIAGGIPPGCAPCPPGRLEPSEGPLHRPQDAAHRDLVG